MLVQQSIQHVYAFVLAKPVACSSDLVASVCVCVCAGAPRCPSFSVLPFVPVAAIELVGEKLVHGVETILLHDGVSCVSVCQCASVSVCQCWCHQAVGRSLEEGLCLVLYLGASPSSSESPDSGPYDNKLPPL